MHNRTRGFSLIELIVVMAIVAVLLALILPPLHKARESARAVVCLGNARTIGEDAGVYRADHPKMGLPRGFGDLDLPETFICPSDPDHGRPPGTPATAPSLSYEWKVPPMSSVLNTYNAVDVRNPSTFMLAGDASRYRHFLRMFETATPNYSAQWERSTRNKSYLDGSARPMIGPGSFALDHTS